MQYNFERKFKKCPQQNHLNLQTEHVMVVYFTLSENERHEMNSHLGINLKSFVFGKQEINFVSKSVSLKLVCTVCLIDV